jgi:hypothetical protein
MTDDGSAYAAFQQTVTAGLAVLTEVHPVATNELDGLVWVKGEVERNDPSSRMLRVRSDLP